jgi:hypothetical protein
MTRIKGFPSHSQLFLEYWLQGSCLVDQGMSLDPSLIS